ncbi:MAG: preprotein translocase subunit SecE [Candidatus Saccharimonadales bacterium]
MADSPKRKLRPAQSIREKSVAAKEEKPIKKRRFASIWGHIKAPFKRLSAYLGKFKVLRIISHIIVPSYLRSSWKEIKLVTWPSRRESRRLTVAVIGFAIIIGAVVASLDYGLSHLFKVIILGK